MWKLSFIFIAIMLITMPAAAQSYEFTVEHLHTARNCRGALIITPDHIEFRTAHKNDARIWEYVDIQQLTVVSPVELELATYEDQPRLAGRDRIFKFKLLEGRIAPEISALLAKQVKPPLVTSVPPQLEGELQFTIPVKHLHAFGGCAGTLKIYADRIVFDAQADGRYWRYSDIQSISQSERYRFEITSYERQVGGAKAYNFQLKEGLPAQAYDYVWSRVYPSTLMKSAQTALPLAHHPRP
jgi:hypothetical protein